MAVIRILWDNEPTDHPSSSAAQAQVPQHLLQRFQMHNLAYGCPFLEDVPGQD